MTRSPRVLVLLSALLVLGACSSGGPGRASDEHPRPSVQPTVQPSGLPSVEPVSCPEPSARVRTADELKAALDTVHPGAVIALADGTYQGHFTLTRSGTAQEPVWLCGSRDAVLQGDGVRDGIVVHLEGAKHWRLVGFSVRNGQKGVVADGTVSSVIQGLTVTEVGDEAVHLRTGSTDDVVRDTTISRTGLREGRFGEGVYVGTAKSNWCELSGCGPDRSDRNAVVHNTITGTTAEAVDVKEGTTGGLVQANTFDGRGMTGHTDSWVDVKGNGWLVQANTGTSSAGSGFQVHAVITGWGTGNTFDGNTADVSGPGYGIELRPAADNRVTCTNTVKGAARGLSNVQCR